MMRNPTLLLLSALAGGLLSCIFSAQAQDAAESPAPTPTEETLAAYPWDSHADAMLPRFAAHAQLVDLPPADARSTGIVGRVLKVTNGGEEPLQVSLLTIDAPPITAGFYAVTGQVRCEEVATPGYLEMWSVFPPLAPGDGERTYFSRTLGETPGDLMERLHGSSGWRPFTLPFNIGSVDRAGGEATEPLRLTVNLVLPGRGTVYLGPLRLAQYHYGRNGTASAPTTIPLNAWTVGVGGLLTAMGVLLIVRRRSRDR